MVGPARTQDDFDRKARTTASAARSTVETVRLVAETASDGNAFGPYSGVSVSEQEDTLTEIQGDFNSIQPPNGTSDDMRAELNEILTASLHHVAAVRIAIRRGELRAAADVAQPLAADSDALTAFLDEHA